MGIAGFYSYITKNRRQVLLPPPTLLQSTTQTVSHRQLPSSAQLSLPLQQDKIKVKVLGDDELFSLSQQDVVGSKTIENLVNYNYDVNEPIHIGVSIDKWLSYVDFLQTGNPTINALQVIDYLDNISQAKTWYLNQYNAGDDHQHIQMLISTHTNFLPLDTIPFVLTTNINQMLPYLDNLTVIPQDYIFHIFDKLYPSDIGYNYSYTLFETNDMLPTVADSIVKYSYILKSTITHNLYVDDNIILSVPNSCLNGPKPAFISPRIAEYYQNNKMYNFSNHLITCPYIHAPYLRLDQNNYHQQQDNINNTNEIMICCSPTENKRFMDINLYNPNSSYQPHSGYITEIQIRDYTLLSYNRPSTYGRDYYVYLPYEQDPYIKVIYAFCI